MGAMKSLYGDMQEACPLNEAEEIEIIRQQFIIEQLAYDEDGNY